MKALALLTLLSLIGCGAQTKKVSVNPPEKAQKPDAIVAPPAEVLSILSKSPLPEKFSLIINDELIFDECVETPERVAIERDIPLIEIDLSTIMLAEHLKIEIKDRLADCTGDSIFYINDRVEHGQPEDNKWTNTRTIFARLNNFPRQIDGENKPRTTQI